MLKLQVQPGVPAVMPPQAEPYRLHGTAATGAPFGAVDSVGGAEGTETLYGSFVGKGLVALWDKMTSFRDLIVFVLSVSVLHNILATKFANEDTAFSNCAVNSWLLWFYVLTLAALVGVTSIVRSIRPLSINFEVGLTLLFVTLGTVLAAASGPHRWKLEQGQADVCSSQTNPLAGQVYLLADCAGTLSMITLGLILLAKPPFGPGWLWLVLFAAIAILVQLTLVDLVVSDELSKSWKYVEVNGTEIDKTLKDVTERIDGIENLLNVTID